MVSSWIFTFFGLYLQSGMGADGEKGTTTRKIWYMQAIKTAAFKEEMKILPFPSSLLEIMVDSWRIIGISAQLASIFACIFNCTANHWTVL